MFWLKVRTPASLANHLSRSFWRSSLRTTSRSEALCAARSVRAALDQGFATVGVGMRLGMLSEAQGEAVITALAQRALADAGSRRSLAGPRGEEAIAAARRSHLAEAAAWRDVLRRNDLAVVAPLVAEAAASSGLGDPDRALVPDLLREAARTLAAVSEENVEREDGHYAGDRARLLARLDADRPIRLPGMDRLVTEPRPDLHDRRDPASVAPSLRLVPSFFSTQDAAMRDNPAAPAISSSTAVAPSSAGRGDLTTVGAAGLADEAVTACADGPPHRAGDAAAALRARRRLAKYVKDGFWARRQRHPYGTERLLMGCAGCFPTRVSLARRTRIQEKQHAREAT